MAGAGPVAGAGIWGGTAAGAVRSIAAGIDLVCISRSLPEVRAALRGLRKAVESGELPMMRIDQAVGRILACKARYAGPPPAWSILRHHLSICSALPSLKHPAHTLILCKSISII